jgi:hypothetical protein
MRTYTAAVLTFSLGIVILVMTISSEPERSVVAASDLTGISCWDVFLNRGLGDIDTSVDGNDLWVGTSLARTFDPGGPPVRSVDIAAVTYFGPDVIDNDVEDYNLDGVNDPSIIADLISDGPAVQFDCQDADATAQGASENGLLHNRLEYSVLGEQVRPTFDGVYDSSSGTLSYGTCDFDESLGVWVRQEASINVDKGINKSTGGFVVYLGTSAPSAQSPPGHATDYTTCSTGSSFTLPYVVRSDEREAATDGLPGFPAVADPSPPNDDSSDGLSDDYDGDGCTDWDELALYGDPAQDGNDPFNPQDCDTVIGGVNYVEVTVTPNTDDNGIGGIISDANGNGGYFHCLVDGQQSGANVTLTPFCYLDFQYLAPLLVNSFSSFANNGAAAPDVTCLPVDVPDTACGDGRAGPKPPKAHNPDAITYAPVGTRYDADASEDGGGAGTCGDELENAGGDTNAVDQFDTDCRNGPVFDPTTLTGTIAGDTLSFSGCFDDQNGIAGPNMVWDGTLNIKTGAGAIDIDIASPNCTMGTPDFNDAALDAVELNTKAGIANVTKLPDTPPVGVGWTTNQTFGPTLDNDHDGCSTKDELVQPAAGACGLRDPFNKWDLFDPTRDGAVGGADFFALLGRFGASGDQTLDPFFSAVPPSPAYHTRFDRGLPIPGAPPCGVGAANGVINGVDFFDLLSQFGNECGITQDFDDAGGNIIGSGGGSVGTGSGDIVEAGLTIPSGALTENTSVTIEALPASSAPNLNSFLGQSPPLVPDADNLPELLARVFDLGPDGQTLNVPATLTLTYTEAATTNGNEATLGVIHYIEAENRWENRRILSRDTINNTITLEIDGFSIYGIYEPVTTDSDSDGCRDVDEQQTVVGTQLAGGRRDPLTYWDFYDTPIGTFPDLVKDGAVTGTDFFAVLARFNSTGDPSADPLAAPPAAPAYHPTYDHTGASIPPSDDAWDVGPPDGAIAGTDFFAVLTNFGHVCVAP